MIVIVFPEMKVGEGEKHQILRCPKLSGIKTLLQVGEIPGSPSPQLHIPKGAFTKETHLVPSGHHEAGRVRSRAAAPERSSASSTFLFAHFWTYVCHEMKRIMVTPEASLNDLVPANLAKARGDAVPVISAKYTKVGESIRRNAPHEVRYDTTLQKGGKKPSLTITERVMCTNHVNLLYYTKYSICT